MNEIYVYMISYGGVLILAFLGFNFWSKGLLLNYLRAKLGKKRGKVLIFVRTPLFYYSKVGVLVEGWLTYKDRNKDTRRLYIPDTNIIPFLNCISVDVDETKNASLKKNYEAVSGFDAVKYEELYIRALNRSKLNDLKQFITIILVVVALSFLFNIIQVALLNGLKKMAVSGFQSCNLQTFFNTTTPYFNQVAQNTTAIISGGI